MNWMNIAKVVLIMMTESTNRLVFAIGYHFLV